MVRVMIFKATFNNISDISWRLALFLGGNKEDGEKHPPAASHRQTLSYNVVSSTPSPSGIRTHNVSGDMH